MPELPEVETIVRGIAPRLTGRTLQNPRLFKSDVLREVSPRRFLSTLRGNRITGVTRRAKHVVITLGTGERMVIQPRMTGALIVYDRPLTREEKRYVVLEAGLGRKASMVYRDVRRLGTISLMDDLIDIVAKGIAQPGKDHAWGPLFALIVSEKIPGTDETYGTRIESVKNRMRETFKRNWSEAQYREFEQWGVDPTEIGKVPDSPNTALMERIMERAKTLGADIPDDK